MRTYPIRVPRLLQNILAEAKFNLDEMDEDLFSLTFDDGPHPESTPLLLSLLDQLSLKVCFFLIGEQAAKYPSLVEEIRAAGHTIGSHGYTHLNGWKSEDQIYLDDVRRACDLLESRIFRPPYGKISRRQYKKLKTHYQIILWSLMPGDFDPEVDSVLLRSRMLTKIRKRDIVVLHDTPHTITKLEEVLPSLAVELLAKKLSHSSL